MSRTCCHLGHIECEDNHEDDHHVDGVLINTRDDTRRMDEKMTDKQQAPSMRLPFRFIYGHLRQRGMNCPCILHQLQTLWWAFQIWWRQSKTLSVEKRGDA